MLILHGILWVGTHLPQQVGSLSKPCQALEPWPCVWMLIDDVELQQSHYGTRQLCEWTFPFPDLKFLKLWS